MSDIIELFEMAISGDRYTYSNSLEYPRLNVGGELYAVRPIKRSDITQSIDTIKSSLDVTISLDDDLAQRLLTEVLNKVVSLTVWTLTDFSPIFAWKGRLSNFSPSKSEMVLTFESIFTSLRRPGLRPTYQRRCRHALYTSACGVSKASYEIISTVTDLADELTLTIPTASSFDDGYFTLGFLEASNGAKSYIVSHVGELITIQRPSFSLTEEWLELGGDLSVKLYAGCDYSRSVCNNKFNNGLNYGGFDWIPTKNPFSGTSVV